MANPNFTPEMSTNQIFRDIDDTRCLTDDLDAIEEDIEALQTGKADTSHTHTGYAEASHNHDEYALAGHTHADYATANHAHTEYAASAHSHNQTEISGLATTLTAKADLVDGKVPESQLPSYVSDIVEAASLSAFPATGASDKIYVAQDTNKTYRWSGSGYVEVSASIAIGETANTAHRGDHGKVAYEHCQNSDVHVTVAQKAAWDAKAAGDHVHNPIVVTTAGENLDTYVTPGTWSFAQAYTPTNIPAGTNGWLVVIPWGDGEGTVKQFWLRHGVPGEGDGEVYTRLKVAATGAWGSWSRFYSTQNPPTAAEVGAIDKALQMVADNGNVEYEMAGLDILATIEDMPTGMHTGYCPVNSTNAPNSNEAWRFMVHKTGATYGWVIAFGSYGSVYSNYLNNGTWRGWKTLIDGTSNPLWKHETDGGYYMTANQTVTPSKPLNQCRNGWVLVWSDYDPATSTTNNADICTTVIPKRNPVGALWSGQGFLCVVPTYMNDADDTDTIHIKKVYVHNDKLVGFAGNNLTDRRDVVLRAVYEY